MTKIKVEIPEGMEVAGFDAATAEVTLRPKPKDISGIRTLADLLADQEMNAEEFEEQCKGLTADERAYRIIKLLAKSLNQGWVPNWDDSGEYKYVPWFNMDGGSSGFRFGVVVYWSSASAVGSRLCFKSRELAQHAGKYFLETYRQFFVIE